MTYEQIQKYPVGTIYYHEEQSQKVRGYWYNDADKKLILKNSTLLDIKFNSDFSYDAIIKTIIENKIDGWIFDGKEWHCAKLTWDGYQEINDERLLNK